MWWLLIPVGITALWIYNKGKIAGVAQASATPIIAQPPAGGQPAASPESVLTVTDIANMQTMLNAVGNAALTVDGVIGSMTRSALSAFQSANGLPATGIYDHTTYLKLAAAYDTIAAKDITPGEQTPSTQDDMSE